LSDYDYLNARVRAMAASLLPAALLDQISRAEGEDIFIDLLLDTAYAQSLTDAQSSSRGNDAAESAIRMHLQASLDKLRKIAPAVPQRLIDIQLNRWDLSNIITIVRGKRKAASTADIMHAMVPAGQYSMAQLEVLASEPDQSAVADALSTWGYPLAPVLREVLRPGEQDHSEAALERSLFGAYYDWALSSLDRNNIDESILLGHMAMQIDLSNIMVLLKETYHRSHGLKSAPAPIIPGGKFGSKLLEDLQKSTSVERALELLELTAFAPAIERGVLSYGRNRRLGDIERFLEIVVLEAGIRLFRLDPLSAGVPLGYIWMKVSEFLNLRILLRGHRYRMPVNAVREALNLG